MYPQVAYGFVRVANEAMCRPIRNLTTMKVRRRQHGRAGKTRAAEAEWPQPLIRVIHVGFFCPHVAPTRLSCSKRRNVLSTNERSNDLDTRHRRRSGTFPAFSRLHTVIAKTSQGRLSHLNRRIPFPCLYPFLSRLKLENVRVTTRRLTC